MRLLLAVIALALASAAWADAPPLTEKVLTPAANAVKTGTLCSGQTATSICVGAHPLTGVSDQLVADLRGFLSVSVYSNQSTATTYTCDIYSSDNGSDADGGIGQDRSSTSLTETQEAIVLDGAIAYIWAKCSAIADNQVTITFVASR